MNIFFIRISVVALCISIVLAQNVNIIGKTFALLTS